MATISCPTTGLASANGSGVAGSGSESISTTARSLCGSVPTTSPVLQSPSLKRMDASLARPTTWAFVTTCEASYTNPVP
ncbi:hypothetical protein LT974_12475 [Halobacterium noricense]|nr:hypothetical protein [Halobacterium noricense]UHH24790.1 hypothetical protein LT974_12475 [Halobacterium noricense]